MMIRLIAAIACSAILMLAGCSQTPLAAVPQPIVLHRAVTPARVPTDGPETVVREYFDAVARRDRKTMASLLTTQEAAFESSPSMYQGLPRIRRGSIEATGFVPWAAENGPDYARRYARLERGQAFYFLLEPSATEEAGWSAILVIVGRETTSSPWRIIGFGSA